MQRLMCAALFVLVGFATPVAAQGVGLAWDPGAGAEGYQVQVGSASGATDAEYQVGPTLEATLDLQPGTYYIRVRSYNLNGFSVDTSNEVVAVVATPPPPPPPPDPVDPCVADPLRVTVTQWPNKSKALRYTASHPVTAAPGPAGKNGQIAYVTFTETSRPCQPVTVVR
jgi:hypothetical protein